MKNMKFLLAAPAVIALLLTACAPPQQQAQKFASEPTILVKAAPSVVMPVLQKEVAATYGTYEITLIDANRLRVANAKNPNSISTFFTLVPKGPDGTLIKVTLIGVTAQGAMAVPWLDGMKEPFLKTGILDRTKAGAETPKS